MTASLWRAEDVVRAVRGQCLHEQTWRASGVAADIRTVAPGDVFVALQDPLHDGHDDVAAAFEAGAVAAIVMRRPLQTLPQSSLIFVEDTLSALWNLGRAARERARAKIIAVTGSVGKTSARDMLRLSLGAVGKTYARDCFSYEQNRLPLALANLPPDADYGIFEMNPNSSENAKTISLAVRPDALLVTLVEDEAAAFPEIFDGLKRRGIAIINRDMPAWTSLSAAAKKRGAKTVLSFSEKGKADAVLRACAPLGDGSAIKAAISKREILYILGTSGRHQAMNSLGVLLTAQAVTGKIDECAAALAHNKTLSGYGYVETIALTFGDITLIDESLHASPASVAAAVSLLGLTEPKGDGRRILVLGDMRDTGKVAPDLHIALAPVIKEAGIDLVYCCGDTVRYLFDVLPDAMRGCYEPTSEDLAFFVARSVQAGDVVLVKGAPGVEMRRVVEALRKLKAAPLQKSINA